MRRPTGVTILAVLSFLVALVLFGNALLLMGGGSFLKQLMSWIAVASNLLADWGSHAVLGSLILGLHITPHLFFWFYCMMAVLYVAIGLGFLRVQNWARLLVIILSIFGLATTALAYATPRLIIFRQSPIDLVIDIVVLIYLFWPKVKQVFGAGAV
jgi:hypothetical protein